MIVADGWKRDRRRLNDLETRLRQIADVARKQSLADGCKLMDIRDMTKDFVNKRPNEEQ